MEKKTIIQIIIILFLFLISIFIYKFYYNTEDQKNIQTNKSDLLENKADNEGQNLIKDIKYISNNSKGDIYEIIADYGETSLENPNLMFLTNVTGNIIFEKKDNIKLISDYANFNTKTFETTFINNVKIFRGEEIVTGNELYLILDQDEETTRKDPKIDQNLIRISHNVFFESPGYTLKADIIEIDLISKNMKIFMNNKIKKVTATGELK
tara:strand:- start:590 stop:1219 length:630 start_codon:yes stop_codon:yes gene_type:complete